MLSPDSAQRILDDAVAEFARVTQFPLTFGGYEASGLANITSLHGNRTLNLLGLQVQQGRGLGGRVMREGRPRLTPDYARSRYITHHYDNEVIGEGVQSLFAMPVIVEGAVRAVLYGGTRGGIAPEMNLLKAGASVARDLAQEIRIEDEVVRRLARQQQTRLHTQTLSSGELPPALREELRHTHAELRRIAATVDDAVLREQLLALERRLTAFGGGLSSASGGVSGGVSDGAESSLANGAVGLTPVQVRALAAGGAEGSDPLASGPKAAVLDRSSPSTEPSVRLTPRELDVLSHVALGATNAEVARSLTLKESTVKSYLNTAMAKLAASTRHAAVVAARRANLIP